MTNVDELQALVVENKRLRAEVRELRERVRAFETSRWHRLHPRRLLPTRTSSLPDVVEPTPRDSPAPEGTLDAGAHRFREEVLSRGAFSEDWLTDRVDRWEPMLDELAGRKSLILEIGSYEGLSACYLLWRLPDANVTCIDTFVAPPDLEARFDRNVALVDASRVRKLVGDSRRLLPDLVEAEARFDFVYVDGSHLGLDVLVDAALSWRLVTPGGVLLFDDYTYREQGEDALLRPGAAIDAFLTVIEGKYEVLFRAHQLAVRKIT